MREVSVEHGVGGLDRGFTNLPHTNAAVGTRGKKPFAIQAESYGILFFKRLGKCVGAFAGLEVPKLDGAIGAGARENFSIGTKGQSKYGTIVAVQRADLLAV